MTKNRIEWIDIARGICMLFVMLSHMNRPNIYLVFFGPFFLSMFFFISGYLYSPRKNFKEYFVRKTRTLLIPFIILGIFNILLREVLSFNAKQSILIQLKEFFLQIGTGSGLWFIACLYIASLLFYPINKYIKNKKIYIVTLYILGIATIIYSKFINIKLPWHIQVYGIAIFFMGHGKLYKDEYEEKLKKYENMKSLIFGMVIYIILLKINSLFFKDYYVISINSYYSGVFTYFAVSLLSIWNLLIISKRFVKSKFIQYIGQNTLVYFAFQGKVQSLLEKVILNIITINKINAYWLCPIAVIIQAVILIIPCIIINRYFPWVIGRVKEKDEGNKSMKIAMIGHKRIPSREGGVERVVEELSTRLVTEGNTVDVYNRKGKNVQDKNADKEVKNIKEYKGVNIKTIPTINKKGIDALLYSFFATIVALFDKYDVIHYHAEGPCAMLWIPHLFGIRTVATIHGLDWQRSKWGGFAAKYLKFGERIAAKYADEIIVLSKGVQKYFKDSYNRETNFIPNGVNKPQNREPNKIKKKWELEKDSYILFLARIVPEKGLHYLIKAFKQIDTDKKLVIAGGASHTNDYLEEIKNMVKDDKRIIMTGFIQGEELDELFSNSFLYCLPSDIEGMPISLLEAMSYGCNCLVSDIEENMQVVGEYAYSFEKSNINDLKAKLLDALNKKDRKNSSDIIEFVCNRYDWNEIVQKTIAIYKNEKSEAKRLI